MTDKLRVGFKAQRNHARAVHGTVQAYVGVPDNGAVDVRAVVLWDDGNLSATPVEFLCQVHTLGLGAWPEEDLEAIRAESRL